MDERFNIAPYHLELKQDGTVEDRAAIARRLDAYNDSQTGVEPDLPLAILIRSPSDGAIEGGLWGRSYYRWLFIELLFIPEPSRKVGLGTRIMDLAEAEARRRGCLGAWLDSFSFQAPGFYEKRGYKIFAQLDDYPPGQSRFFLSKRLND